MTVTFKAWGIIVGTIVGGFVVVFVATFFADVMFHNFNFQIIQRNFHKIKHPVESILLTGYAEIAHYGNSNYCDYLIGEFRKSALSREEILREYKDAKIINFDKKVLPIEVYFLEDDIFTYVPWSVWLEDAKLSTTLNQNVYLVYTEALSYPSDNDYRCH